MKTYSAKPSEIEKKWFVVDAEGVVLGRLATVIAMRLRGKHKPIFTPHMDTGDNIIVINAEKVKITGKKGDQSIFYWHTGYVGGIKERTQNEILNGRFPNRVLENAVRRMLPKNTMGRDILKNLKVYAGSEHPHASQNPTVLDVAGMNAKNKR
ncbi:MAG: 50S ribosomal protein L13 [Micavibrio aeruginosavorus]|uniref:Large ribosomal subunit protein uL13 n=1 Tax=Micavibrio aeruginosavorus TaxID=349221 RepID=A0A2W5FSV3_9BACT|nr:MAG: 50S ribosomal protein L13 [Micavibrio aeruginosavorus]